MATRVGGKDKMERQAMTDIVERLQLTDEQRKLLAPHGEHFRQMAVHIRHLPADDFARLLAAAEAATNTNCSWDIGLAAEFLREEMRAWRRLQRKQA